MRKDYEKLSAHLTAPEPSAGLFGRIILAIKREQELRRTRRLLFGFSCLLLVSLIATPLSGAFLVGQIEKSGISYFISTAISDPGTFFVFWQDFSLAILESLPTGSIITFFLSLAVSVFALRLFLHKRRTVFEYLMQNFA